MGISIERDDEQEKDEKKTEFTAVDFIGNGSQLVEETPKIEKLKILKPQVDESTVKRIIDFLKWRY